MIVVDYTVSDRVTYNLVHCFTDVKFPGKIDQVIDLLPTLYPMFQVYIENIGDEEELAYLIEQAEQHAAMECIMDY